MVGRHVVLKANNYDLESGMPSVFDTGELNKDKSSEPLPPRATPPSPARGGPNNKKKDNKQSGANKPARVASKAEQARLAHNKSVASRAEGDELRRAVFLSKHLSALRPFVTEKVAAAVEALANSAGTSTRMLFDVRSYSRRLNLGRLNSHYRRSDHVRVRLS